MKQSQMWTLSAAIIFSQGLTPTGTAVFSIVFALLGILCALLEK